MDEIFRARARIFTLLHTKFQHWEFFPLPCSRSSPLTFLNETGGVLPLLTFFDRTGGVLPPLTFLNGTGGILPLLTFLNRTGGVLPPLTFLNGMELEAFYHH